MDGKTAIITGAGRGIGRALAEALAEAGAKVVVASRTETELKETVKRIKDAGGEALAIKTDVAREADLDRLVKKTLEKFGRIDVLVNNAGTQSRHPAEKFPLAEWDRVMRVNLRGVFLLCQKAGRVMIRQGGGKIVNVASLQSEISGKNIVAYTASKGGIRQLTRALAREWGKYNINVNAIGPGYIRTVLNEALYTDPKRNREILDRMVIRRWGEPEDLKGVVVFLASAASDYMTGQIIYVDGGWLAG